ncbi:VOC family protein [Chachezhania sediminis]|uniref:VOC family protein n=1 Tax=Chachezhania sediminis TaxID=2599291 RepID=UPI00131D9E89|nr:VOC family protein [Chachezhania sediminis]
MKIERLDRVVLGVRDMDGVSGFFEDLLGLRFDPLLSDPAVGMDARYSREGLELVAGHPGTAVDRFTETRGEGVFCVVFKVADMDEAIAHFRARGLEPVNDVTFGAMREVAFHPAGSHGMQIVLAEYPERHPATDAVLGGA